MSESPNYLPVSSAGECESDRCSHRNRVEERERESEREREEKEEVKEM